MPDSDVRWRYSYVIHRYSNAQENSSTLTSELAKVNFRQ